MTNSEKACDEFLQTIHSDAYYSGLSESEQKLWNTAWSAAIEFAANVCEDMAGELMTVPSAPNANRDAFAGLKLMTAHDKIRKKGAE